MLIGLGAALGSLLGPRLMLRSVSSGHCGPASSLPGAFYLLAAAMPVIMPTMWGTVIAFAAAPGHRRFPLLPRPPPGRFRPTPRRTVSSLSAPRCTWVPRSPAPSAAGSIPASPVFGAQRVVTVSLLPGRRYLQGCRRPDLRVSRPLHCRARLNFDRNFAQDTVPNRYYEVLIVNEVERRRGEREADLSH